MTVSFFPFKESESSLFTSVARNLRPTCAYLPPPPPAPRSFSPSVLCFSDTVNPVLFVSSLFEGGGGLVEEGGLI